MEINENHHGVDEIYIYKINPYKYDNLRSKYF